MGWVLVNYAIEATPLAVIVYAVMWRIIGKPKVDPLRLDRTSHVAGATTVVLGSGVTRLATAYVLGGQTMQDLWTNQGVGLVGPVGVPILLSIVVVRFLRTKARPTSGSG
jgi:hypothetical protein